LELLVVFQSIQLLLRLTSFGLLGLRRSVFLLFDLVKLMLELIEILLAFEVVELLLPL
jgi:hypothetical protein